MNHMDIFNDDAFSLVNLVAQINNMDHVPSRAGQLAFAGTGEGVPTLSVSIESKAEVLSLIQTSPRGAPAPQEKQDKANIRNVHIPQIKLEDTIGAHQIQGVRQFGSTDVLRGAQSVVSGQMQKMVRRHDMTLENHRLGALRGVINDADGSELLDLFDLFGVTAPADVPFHLDDFAADAYDDFIRATCAGIIRTMKRNLKMPWNNGIRVWAFCGDTFFDKLLEHPSFKEAYQATERAAAKLGDSYVHGVVEFGGIFFENYQGTDDNTTVAVSATEARFFLTGVPGLYAEYFAPADFMETANTIGLPRYAKIAPDAEFNRFVKLHTQQNPLPLCLRPKTLIRGTITA